MLDSLRVSPPCCGKLAHGRDGELGVGTIIEQRIRRGQRDLEHEKAQRDNVEYERSALGSRRFAL